MTITLRYAILFIGLAALSAMPTEAQELTYRQFDGRECPILDMPFFNSSSVSVGYALPADTTAPAWEEVSAVEMQAWGRWFNWSTTTGGDLDVRGHWDTMILNIDGPESDSYPLTMARVEMEWSQRFLYGYGLQLDAAPGLYSSLDSIESDDFAVPCGLTLIKALNPDFALLIGASVFPTFDQAVDPRIGLRIARADSVILDLAYPESKLELRPHQYLRFTVGARMRLWPEYNMGDDPRERLLYEEGRAYSRLEIAMTEYMGLRLEGGYLFNRSISFETGDTDVDLDDAPFANIGLYTTL